MRRTSSLLVAVMQLKGLKKRFRGGGTIANFVQQGAGRGRFFSARRRKERPEGVSLGAAPSRFFSKRCGRAGTARAMKSIENKPRRVPKPWQNHPREVKNHPKRVPKPSENLPREVQGGSWDPSGPPLRKRTIKKQGRHQRGNPFWKVFSHFSQKVRCKF